MICISKFLFIGLGGAGGKTLRVIAQRAGQQLRQDGWEGDLPAAWQFLHLDAPLWDDTDNAFFSTDVGHIVKRVSISTSTEIMDPYRRYSERLRGPNADSSRIEPGLTGWAPKPDAKTILSPVAGAGQMRSVGRFYGLAAFEDRIAPAIDSALGATNSEEATLSLGRLQALRAIEGENMLGAPDGQTVVFIISTLGGGFGSGVIGDVTAYVAAKREVDPAAGLFTVIYDSSVALSVPVSGPQPGIAANTLAGFSELINAHLLSGVPTPEPDAILSREILRPEQPGTPQSAPTNFVIGAQDGESRWRFNDAQDVYRNTGRALSALLLRPKLFQGMCTQAHDRPTPVEFGSPSLTPLDFGDSELPLNDLAQSFGFATVGLGSEIFRSYAAEAISRRLIETLLEGPELPSGSENITARQHHMRLAEAEGPSFRIQAGVGDHAQLLAQLWDLDDFGNEWQRFKTENPLVAGLIKDASAVPEGVAAPGGITTEAALKVISQAFLHGDSGWAQRVDQKVSDALRATKERIWTATLRSLPRVGSHAGLLMLEDLASDCQSAVGQLEAAIELESQQLSQFRAQITQHKDSRHEDTPKSKARSESLTDSLEGMLRAESRIWSLRLAAATLRSTGKDLLPCLGIELRKLSEQLNSAPMGRTVQLGIESWSELGQFPAGHLCPAPNELLLVDLMEFPVLLASKLAETTGTTSESEAVACAGAEILSGAFPRAGSADGQDSQLWFDVEWHVELPVGADPNAGDDARCRVTWNEEVSPFTIQKLCFQWIAKRESSAIRDYIGLSLIDWLSDPQEATHRQRAYVDGLIQAASLAQPMVEVDPATHFRAYGGDGPPEAVYLMSEIPVPSDAKRLIDDIDNDFFTLIPTPSASLQGLLSTESTRTTVELLTTLDRSVHPIVLKSVMTPLHESWQACSLPRERRIFGMNRRARGLKTFLPVAPARLEAMIRGWLVADFLGQISLPSPDSEGVGIWTPEGETMIARFPFSGGEFEAGPQLLPMALETLPLAMAEFGSGNHNALDGFARLIELAKGNELEQWFREGIVKEANPWNSSDPPPIPPEVSAGPSREREPDFELGAGEYYDSVRTEKFLDTLDFLAENLFLPALDDRDSVTPNTTERYKPLWDIADVALQQVAVLQEQAQSYWY